MLLIQNHAASNGEMVLNDDMKSMSKVGVGTFTGTTLYHGICLDKPRRTHIPKLIHSGCSVLRWILEADTCRIQNMSYIALQPINWVNPSQDIYLSTLSRCILWSFLKSQTRVSYTKTSNTVLQDPHAQHVVQVHVTVCFGNL